MSGLRDEIRAILREEIAALTSGGQGTPTPIREQVHVMTSADLNRFAQDLVARAAQPGFAEQVMQGGIRFELAASRPVGGPIVQSAPQPSPDVIDKPLVTERDITALSARMQTVRLGKTSRLTPLARDEARRRGIRIERIEK